MTIANQDLRQYLANISSILNALMFTPLEKEAYNKCLAFNEHSFRYCFNSASENDRKEFVATIYTMANQMDLEDESFKEFCGAVIVENIYALKAINAESDLMQLSRDKENEVILSLTTKVMQKDFMQKIAEVALFDDVQIPHELRVWHAARLGDWGYVVEESTKGDVDVNLTPSDADETTLWLAVYYKQFDVAKKLIACGADINKVPGAGSNFEGMSILWMAMNRNDSEFVDYLLKLGPNPDLFPVNYAGYEGVSALYLSAMKGEWKRCDTILSMGGDPNILPAIENFVSAIMLKLARSQQWSLVNRIIDLSNDGGVILSELGNEEGLFIWLAAKNGQWDLVKKMLGITNNLNYAPLTGDLKGMSILWLAANDGKWGIVGDLIKKGAEVRLTIQNKLLTNENLFSIAEFYGKHEFLFSILDARLPEGYDRRTVIDSATKIKRIRDVSPSLDDLYIQLDSKFLSGFATKNNYEFMSRKLLSHVCDDENISKYNGYSVIFTENIGQAELQYDNEIYLEITDKSLMYKCNKDGTLNTGEILFADPIWDEMVVSSRLDIEDQALKQKVTEILYKRGLVSFYNGVNDKMLPGTSTEVSCFYLKDLAQQVVQSKPSHRIQEIESCSNHFLQQLYNTTQMTYEDRAKFTADFYLNKSQEPIYMKCPTKNHAVIAKLEWDGESLTISIYNDGLGLSENHKKYLVTNEQGIIKEKYLNTKKYKLQTVSQSEYNEIINIINSQEGMFTNEFYRCLGQAVEKCNGIEIDDDLGHLTTSQRGGTCTLKVLRDVLQDILKREDYLLHKFITDYEALIQHHRIMQISRDPANDAIQLQILNVCDNILELKAKLDMAGSLDSETTDIVNEMVKEIQEVRDESYAHFVSMLKEGESLLLFAARNFQWKIVGKILETSQGELPEGEAERILILAAGDGKWDIVLSLLSNYSPSLTSLYDVYEQRAPDNNFFYFAIMDGQFNIARRILDTLVADINFTPSWD